MPDDIETGSEVATVRAAVRRLMPPDTPLSVIVYLSVVEVCAFLWMAFGLIQIPARHTDWLLLAMFAALAIALEEGLSRAARLRFRLSSDLKQDMTSVWAVAAAIALPGSASVIFLLALLLHQWFRQTRPAGQPWYRYQFYSATVVLGCLAAGAANRWSSGAWMTLPWALSGSLCVLVVLIAYAVVQRGLISGALLLTGAGPRALVGTRDDNLLEAATLCLGGLLSLAAIHEPWLCILVVIPMITLQRAAVVRELEVAAMTDAKTGLMNAVSWEHLARRELARGQRERSAVSVLLIDIDRFKRVNDRYGHLVGDVTLREIGRLLSSTLREYDTVGRFGGEEFVAVLPNASDEVALAAAERVRDRVNQLLVRDIAGDAPHQDDDRMAVSIGVACAPTDGSDLTELLHAADQALYVAKGGGRNRVELARRGGELPDVVPTV